MTNATQEELSAYRLLREANRKITELQLELMRYQDRAMELERRLKEVRKVVR